MAASSFSSPTPFNRGANGMIARIVSFALRQRFVIVIASLALMVWGAFSFLNLPIDAYPDLSPPHVEIITQWPGHAAEEVERLVTIPLEIEMNGIPRLEALRSISLYGLSAIEMNFEYGASCRSTPTRICRRRMWKSSRSGPATPPRKSNGWSAFRLKSR